MFFVCVCERSGRVVLDFFVCNYTALGCFLVDVCIISTVSALGHFQFHCVDYFSGQMIEIPCTLLRL